MAECPPIDPPLLEWLDEVFPNVLPRASEVVTVEQLRFKQGQRDVIDRLKHELRVQLERT